jgi:hypothetical protein
MLKMQQLRDDFKKVLDITAAVRKRERLKLEALRLRIDGFEQVRVRVDCPCSLLDFSATELRRSDMSSRIQAESLVCQIISPGCVASHDHIPCETWYRPRSFRV